MNDNVTELITALGAVCELCGELKRQLIRNGFTTEEVIPIVGSYLNALLIPNKNKEDK